METTGMVSPFLRFGCSPPAASRRRRREPATVRLEPPPGRGSERGHGSRGLLALGVEIPCKLRRERRLDVDTLTVERVREGEPGRMQELPPERRLRHAVDGVPDHRQIDRSEVD